MPRHLSFLELSNRPEKSLFNIHWYQECPSLVPCGRKVEKAVVCSIPQEECNHGISPTSTYNAQTPHLFQNCQTCQKNHFLLFTDIKNALVWCHVAQKWVGGSLQLSLGGVQPWDQPHIHLQCPNTSPFLELSNRPEKSLLLFTDIKNALVWCHVVQK